MIHKQIAPGRTYIVIEESNSSELLNIDAANLIYRFYVQSLITVSIRLEWAINRDTDVVGLFFGKNGQLSTKGRKVQLGDLFVKGLRKDVNLSACVFVGVAFVPKFKLGKNLVSEGARHDERWVTGGTSQVKKTTFGQDDDALVFGFEDEFVDLWLDVDALGGLFKSIHINFVIEVTDVSNDGVVLHLLHTVHHKNSLVTGCGDENVSGFNDIFKRTNSEPFHTCLEGTDWVDFGDVNDTSVGTHCGGTPLTDITVSTNDGFLSGKHDIGGTHDTVGEGVLASVQVVEFRFGNGIVNIDGGEKKGSSLFHGVKTVDTGGGFFRNSVTTSGDLVPLVGFTGFQNSLDDGQNNLEFGVVGGGRIWEGSVLKEKVFGLLTFVDDKGHITTVIDDDITPMTLAIIFRPGKGVQCAFPVFFKGFSLPGEDSGRFVTGDGGGSVVLCGKDVTRAPTDVSTKFLQSFDKNSSLDGHVKRSRNTGTLEWFGSTEFSSASHKSRHFNLGELDVLTTIVGKGNISNWNLLLYIR